MLAAPGLRDDFYLDLVCWSRLDVIAVGLGSRVRLYRASNLKELCDVGIGDAVASLAWSPDGRRLAVGCASGKIALYDVGRGVVVTPANGHRGRVGCLDWRGDVLASGSRDRGVACRDVSACRAMALRVSPRNAQVRVSPRRWRWKAHRQEVCGLRWSPGGDSLATGGQPVKFCHGLLNGAGRRAAPDSLICAQAATTTPCASGPRRSSAPAPRSSRATAPR